MAVAPKLKHLNITLETDLDNNLPEISMDRDRIKQVLWNLIMNGVEAMPGGGIIHVFLHHKKDSGTILYGVRDKGQWINKNIADKLTFF